MEAAASVISIIQITGDLIKFLRAARHAGAERRKLLLEANTLHAMLTSLKDFAEVEDPDDFPDWRRAVHGLEAPEGPFALYQAEITVLLRKIDPQRRRDRAVQTVLWRVAKEDFDEMMARLERLKSLVSIALEMDHTRLSEAILAAVDSLNEMSQLIKLDTSRLVNSADEAAFKSVLQQICPEDYSTVFESNITEHTWGIGQEFTTSSKFQSWAGPGDTPKTLLCLGDPGVGKTVLATKAIQALRTTSVQGREAIIFVYCDCTRRRSRLARRDSSPQARSQTTGHFVASLLRQLVEAYRSQTPALQEMMKRHEQQKTRPKAAELAQALVDLAQEFDRVYMVVDAMDECDSLEMETFAGHLLSICSAPAVRLLLTSRRHPQIEQIFEGSSRLDMRASDDDTLLYLRSRARREFPPRVVQNTKALARILGALLASSNGIPLIARLHMDELRGLRTPGAMLAAISKLQSQSDVYDETYHRAMERITKQPGELPAMATRVIRWIVCAKRYIHIRELQCILAMGDESDSIDDDFVPDESDVFLACEGLVCAVADSSMNGARLELVHTTARQYFDRHLARYAPDANLDLTRTCLNLLSFADPSPLPWSLVVYAWNYWGEHAKDVEELDDSEQFAELVSLARKFFANGAPGGVLSQKMRGRRSPSNCRAPLDERGLTGYHCVAKFGWLRLFEACWELKPEHGAALVGLAAADEDERCR